MYIIYISQELLLKNNIGLELSYFVQKRCIFIIKNIFFHMEIQIPKKYATEEEKYYGFMVIQNSLRLKLLLH